MSSHQVITIGYEGRTVDDVERYRAVLATTEGHAALDQLLWQATHHRVAIRGDIAIAHR